MIALVRILIVATFVILQIGFAVVGVLVTEGNVAAGICLFIFLSAGHAIAVPKAAKDWPLLAALAVSERQRGGGV